MWGLVLLTFLRRYRAPLLAFLITRLGVMAVAYVSQPLLVDNLAPPPYYIRPDNLVLDALASRWDTGFYLSIAEQGYSYTPGTLSSVAFWPLLPLLMRVVMVVIGDPLWAGVLVSHLALLGASLVFYRLVADQADEATAGRAVWYLLIFPTSLFGSAIYTESLFLLTAISALYLARRGAWPAAGLVGAACAATRLLGLLVVPVLLLTWWQAWRAGRAPVWAVVAVLAPVLGTLAYMAYLQWAFGDPLLFARASAEWGRAAASPWVAVGDLFVTPPDGWGQAVLAGRLPIDNWIDLAFSAVFIGMGLELLRQRRWAEGVFVLLGALAPLGSGLLMSQRRYVWVLFPVFIRWAEWGRFPTFDRAYTALGLLGLGLFTALFANWYWVG